MRQGAGLTVAALAEALDWPKSKVSKLENGRQFPSADDLTSWGQACQVESGTIERLIDQLDSSKAVHVEFRKQAADGQVPVQEGYTELYRSSRRVVKVETVVVPGPLQTVDYARALMTIAAVRTGAPLGDVGEAARRRAARYDLILDPEREVEILVWEPVLHLVVGSSEVMLAQLDRLQTVIGLPGVRFGIVPLDAPVVEVPRAFSIFDRLVVVEGQGSATFDERPEAFGTYTAMAERLWSMAVEGDQARTLIVAAAERHRR